MIARVCGKIIKKKELGIVLDVNGISYEVMIPPSVMQSIEKAVSPEGMVSLVTYHYYQMDPSKAVPVLIGFANEIEKEFFERFITVSGVGPKAACKAMTQPFSVIADAIDSGDMKLLKSLPGIGEQKAREIVAKLQGKVGKFGLIRDKGAEGPASPAKEDIKEEALKVLLQLQYKSKEAEEMISKAIQRNLKIASCEDILNEVYKGKAAK
jgi:Holliday junction DNA helicase RuvA